MEENSGNFDTVQNTAWDDSNIELSNENVSVTQLCRKSFCVNCVIDHPDMVRAPPVLSSVTPEMSQMAFQTNRTTNNLSASSKREHAINFGKRIEGPKKLKFDVYELQSVLTEEKEKIEQLLTPDIRSMHIASKVLIRLPDDDFNSFLSKIYEKIESGDELLTFHRRIVGKNLCKDLLGKISIWQNKLCFHCLEENKQEDCKALIQFEDLRKIVGSVKFGHQIYFMPFLKISDRDLVLMIKLVSSHLLPQFIRLCTGEYGSSYKNNEYKFSFEVRQNLSSVKCKDGCEISYMVATRYKRITHCNYDNEINDLRNGDYILESNQGKRLSTKIFVVSDSSGCFDIFMAERDVPPSNCIGEIDNSLYTFDCVTTNGKVVDCGISFNLRLK